MTISPSPLQSLQGIIVLRTDRNNLIAKDDQDPQEYVLAECCSPAIAESLLALLKNYNGEQHD